jgi:hypothetical protein
LGAPLWLWAVAVLFAELLFSVLLLVEPHAATASAAASVHTQAMDLDMTLLIG